MKKIAFGIGLLFILSSLNAQPYQLKLTMAENPYRVAIVTGFENGKEKPLDTLRFGQDNSLVFPFANDQEPGIFRFYFSSQAFLDFVFNKENIGGKQLPGFVQFVGYKPIRRKQDFLWLPEKKGFVRAKTKRFVPLHGFLR